MQDGAAHTDKTVCTALLMNAKKADLFVPMQTYFVYLFGLASKPCFIEKSHIFSYVMTRQRSHKYEYFLNRFASKHEMRHSYLNSSTVMSEPTCSTRMC